MFIHSCTIYNKRMDDRTEVWQRTVLHGVLFEGRRGANFNRTGVSGVDSVRVFMPMTLTGYKPPSAWNACPAGSWTLQYGDRIVKGVCTLGITKPSELTGCEAYVITSVDRRDYGGGMRHWEVGAK